MLLKFSNINLTTLSEYLVYTELICSKQIGKTIGKIKGNSVHKKAMYLILMVLGTPRSIFSGD